MMICVLELEYFLILSFPVIQTALLVYWNQLSFWMDEMKYKESGCQKNSKLQAMKFPVKHFFESYKFLLGRNFASIC